MFAPDHGNLSRFEAYGGVSLGHMLADLHLHPYGMIRCRVPAGRLTDDGIAFVPLEAVWQVSA